MTAPFLAGTTLTASSLNQLRNSVRIIALKTADETVNNTTTYQPDNDLLVSVPANSQYFLHLHGAYNSSATAGLRIRFALPAGATLTAGTFLSGGTGSNTQHGSNPSSTGTLSGILGTGVDSGFDVWHTLTVGATAGVVALEWAQDIAQVSNTTMRTGSSLLLERVA